MLSQRQKLARSAFILFISFSSLLLMAVAVPARSQGNSCIAQVALIARTGYVGFDKLGIDQALLVNPLVKVTGEARLNAQGDFAPVSQFQKLESSADGKAWGVTLFKVHAGLPEKNSAYVALALMGEAALTSEANPSANLVTATLTNRNKTALNVFAGPGVDRKLIGTLEPLEKVQVNGRTETADWLRIERDGSLGWVAASGLAVDLDLGTLPKVGSEDVTPLYRGPLQLLSLRTGTPNGCKDTPNGLLISAPVGSSARFLINGVELRPSGSVFLTANETTFTATALTGRIQVAVGGSETLLTAGSSVQVPLENGQAKGAPGNAAKADAGVPLALSESLFNGQTYAERAVPNVTIRAASEKAVLKRSLQLELGYTGDAAACPVDERTRFDAPLDVVVVVDASGDLSGATLEATRAGIARFMNGLPRGTHASLIAYGDTPKLLSPLDTADATVAASLRALARNTKTSLHVGISAAATELKTNGRANARKAVVVLTTGGGEVDFTKQAAEQIKAAKADLIMLPIGAGADQSLATSIATQTRVVTNITDLRMVLDDVRLSLTRPVAAQNVSLVYTYDPAKLLLDDAVIKATGGQRLDSGTVEWRENELAEGASLSLPLTVQPLASGSLPLGAAKIFYSTCASAVQKITTEAIPAPTISVSVDEADLAGAMDSVSDLTPAAGKLEPYGARTLLVDVPADQTYGVLMEGGPLTLLLDGVEPLYSLRNYESAGRQLHVFYLTAGAHRLTVVNSGVDVLPYTISLAAGEVGTPLALLKPDAQRLTEAKSSTSSPLYEIQASAGQLVTLYFRPDDPVEAKDLLPVQIASLDGQRAEILVTQFDTLNNQWISVQRVRGTGAYYAAVDYTKGAFTIALESDDTLTSSRGTIQPGETRRQVAKNNIENIYRYDLTIPKGGRHSLTVSGNASGLDLLDAQNKAPVFSSAVDVNRYRVSQVDLAEGQYTLYIRSRGDYELTVAAGDVSSSLRGTLGLGQARGDSIPQGQAFTAYRLAFGSGKPLGAGDTVTLNLLANAGDPSGDSAYIESADGQRSSVTQDFIDRRNSRNPNLISVQTLQGVAPYRIRVSGVTSYTLRVDAGDLLTNDKGTLIVGQVLRDSSRSPEILYYTLTPQLGKTLGDGDVVTLGFTPQGNDGDLNFDSVQVALVNGEKQSIPADETYKGVTGRQFFSVYTLRGAGPYRFGVPNIGSYSLSFRSGNTINVDEGKLGLSRPLQGRTDGPQIIRFSVEADPGQIVTLRIADTRRERTDFRTIMRNAAGEVIKPRRAAIADNGQLSVYVLRGEGPYSFQFEMEGIYELQIDKGDALTLFQGTFYLGDAETKVVPDRLRVVTYALNLTAGQEISVQLDNNLVRLLDPFDTDVAPDARYYSFTPETRYTGMAVFTARYTGVYELSFPRVGAYVLRVTPGDVTLKDKGNLYYGPTENDEYPQQVVSGRYTVTGAEGDLITLRTEFGTGKTQFGYSIEPTDNPFQLLDANGDLLQIEDELRQNGFLSQVYRLSGPGPYTLLFKPDESFSRFSTTKFKLILLKGDELALDKGVLSNNSPISDDAGDARKRVIYTLDGKAGAGITVNLESVPKQGETKRYYFPALKDASGRTIEANGYAVDKNTSLASFTLSGNEPYQLSFVLSGKYNLNVADGDILQVDLGALVADTPVTNTIKGPAQAATYLITGKVGDAVSLQAKRGTSPLSADLRDANGALVEVQNVYFDRGVALYLYRLSGPGPYKLYVAPGANQAYSLTLSGNDVLNVNMGALPANPATSDDPKFKPTVFQGKLPAPARVASHTIEGKSGDLITLQLAPKSGDALKPRLLNKEGSELAPALSVLEGNKLNNVYKLDGTGPYTLSFEAISDYDATLTTGDILRVDKGALPTGTQEKPYQNKLDAPARVAVHSLDVTAGQIVTLQVQNSGKKVTSRLLDGNGAEIAPEVTDFQNGNNVGVYILSGSGPYTVEFTASGQYTASVLTGNQLRIDGGLLAFKQTVNGTLPAPAKVGTYLIDGKRDQTITIRLQADNKTAVEFRDANGKLWEPDFRFAKGQDLYLVFVLSGPAPYSIAFGGQKYQISVDAGNLVRAELGTIPQGQKVSGKLDAPAQVAVYKVEANPGALLSVQLSGSNRPLDSELRDAQGRLLKRDTAVVRGQVQVTVYTLSGNGPYSLEFIPNAPYELTVSAGNALRVDQGYPALGTPITATLPAPGLTAIYSIDGQPDDVISIEVQVNNKPGKSKLYDVDGNLLVPDVRSEKNNFERSIITLTGKGPYRLEFDADGQYKLTVTPGNVLRVYKGVIRFGNTIADQLKDPQQIAVYTIDGVPDETISVQLQDNNQPANSQLRDADGVKLQPVRQTNANSATYTVYTLSGKAPYTLTFVPSGKYSLTLREGSVLNKEFGVLPFGAKDTQTLQLPAQTAIYSLQTGQGQIITVQITGGTQNKATLQAELRDGEGTIIAPQTRIQDGKGTVYYVYHLSSAGPYRFAFDPTGSYTVQFLRGDASVPNFGIFPTATPTPTPTPGS